eukprot:31330-Pelagococcus_subviridis.AAC.12
MEQRVVEQDGVLRHDGDPRAQRRLFQLCGEGVELKGVRGGVERRRGVSGLMKARGTRRETPGEKVLKDRRSPRRRGRTGTSVIYVERASDVDAVDADGAGGDVVHSEQEPQQRRLAAAARADDADGLSGRDVQRDIVYDHPVGRVPEGDVLQGHRRARGYRGFGFGFGSEFGGGRAG